MRIMYSERKYRRWSLDPEAGKVMESLDVEPFLRSYLKLEFALGPEPCQ